MRFYVYPIAMHIKFLLIPMWHNRWTGEMDGRPQESNRIYAASRHLPTPQGQKTLTVKLLCCFTK